MYPKESHKAGSRILELFADNDVPVVDESGNERDVVDAVQIVAQVEGPNALLIRLE
jgi:hypothetical protein